MSIHRAVLAACLITAAGAVSAISFAVADAAFMRDWAPLTQSNAIEEPGSLALLGIGMLGVAFLVRHTTK